MPTAMKVGAHAHPSVRKEPTPVHELNLALVHLLRAIPVGHLDKRLGEVEKWVRRLEKDVAKALAPQARGRAPGATVATVKKASARVSAPRLRAVTRRRPVARRAR